MTHASESQHFYHRDGEPCYEVKGKSGDMRPATLRDARTMGLVPGVSTILQMEAKPQLTNWLVDQALLSALTLPRLDGETDDAFIVRAKEDSKQQAKRAAEKGKRIHAAIEAFFAYGNLDLNYAREVVAVSDWIHQRYGGDGWRVECSFAHPLGYGGKADLLGLGIVADIKTKDFGPEKEGIDLAWPEHIMQLAAYAHGFEFEKPDCVNVFVSTRIPGLIRIREWDDAEIAEGLEAFKLLLRLYKIRKKFDPSFTTKEAA
jgi:hypothetical protein